MASVALVGAASVVAVWLMDGDPGAIAVTALVVIAALAVVVFDQVARVSGGWKVMAMMRQASDLTTDRQRADIRAAEADRYRSRQELATLRARLDQERAELDDRAVDLNEREQAITARVAQILELGERLATGDLEVRQAAAGDRFARAVLGPGSVIEMRRPRPGHSAGS